jgi:type II secretory pathway component GspD/PulD (secretin)
MKTLRWFLPFSMRTLVIILSVVFIAGSVTAEASERLISLEIRERPLKEVLQQIAGETGYTFKFESTWSNHTVSARADQVPLQSCLRQILGGLNHALVYLPDRTIKIVIMEDTPLHGSASSAGTARPRRPFIPAPAPPPTAESEPQPSPEQGNQVLEGEGGSETN